MMRYSWEQRRQHAMVASFIALITTNKDRSGQHNRRTSTWLLLLLLRTLLNYCCCCNCVTFVGLQTLNLIISECTWMHFSTEFNFYRKPLENAMYFCCILPMLMPANVTTKQHSKRPHNVHRATCHVSSSSSRSNQQHMVNSLMQII